MEHIQTEKPILAFEVWLEELAKVTAEQTGMTLQRARSIMRPADAKTWWRDGYTPFATFRETYNNENDSDI
ncbi:MAG TPA: hypothetical protein VKQ08_04745 [Cyclobacteriaceae bacterium]|nr:hypothetical protein [Cyclobacteriaceae bacterium]